MIAEKHKLCVSFVFLHVICCKALGNQMYKLAGDFVDWQTH